VIGALVTLHAKRMCRIMVACLVLPNFYPGSHKWDDIQKKKVTEHKVCSDFLYNLRLKHVSV